MYVRSSNYEYNASIAGSMGRFRFWLIWGYDLK